MFFVREPLRKINREKSRPHTPRLLGDHLKYMLFILSKTADECSSEMWE